mmetsp:Transcript_2244/g.6664  ORF Transcript_2244/g.6664 Transcript_2244/m.6664 type:complete len:231 (+) Transcript_2244:224-916(+)
MPGARRGGERGEGALPRMHRTRPHSAAASTAAATHADPASRGQLGATCRCGSGLARHPVLDLSRHRHECLLHVGRVLCRRLQKLDAQRIRKLLGHLRGHHLLGGEIHLVAHQQLVHVWCRVAVDLAQPLLHVVERVHVRHIVDDDDAVCAAVVAASDGPEALLARRVPNLKLDGLPLQVDGADLEIDADGGDVAVRVGIICEAEQQTRLADTGITDEEQLEQVVVFGVQC